MAWATWSTSSPLSNEPPFKKGRPADVLDAYGMVGVCEGAKFRYKLCDRLRPRLFASSVAADAGSIARMCVWVRGGECLNLQRE